MNTTEELHKTRINGWRLKPYFSQVIEYPAKAEAEAEQVNLDISEPLGEIAQDHSLAHHVPCIDIMSIRPITRPCIGTVLCDPGTTSDHLVTSREDECTSRLQGDNGADTTQGLEQEA